MAFVVGVLPDAPGNMFLSSFPSSNQAPSHILLTITHWKFPHNSSIFFNFETSSSILVIFFKRLTWNGRWETRNISEEAFKNWTTAAWFVFPTSLFYSSLGRSPLSSPIPFHRSRPSLSACHQSIFPTTMSSARTHVSRYLNCPQGCPLVVAAGWKWNKSRCEHVGALPVQAGSCQVVKSSGSTGPRESQWLERVFA